jgi:hypothetical protein
MDPVQLQRRIIERLLAHHPAMRTLEQLSVELGGADVEPAVEQLVSEGLVTRLGELVGASWVTVKLDRLRSI